MEEQDHAFPRCLSKMASHVFSLAVLICILINLTFSPFSNLSPLPQSFRPVRRGDWHVVSAQQWVQDHRRYQSQAALSHEVRLVGQRLLTALRWNVVSIAAFPWVKMCLFLVRRCTVASWNKWNAEECGNSDIVADGMWNVPFGWEEAAAQSKPDLF